MRETVKLKGQLYLLRTGRTQQHRFGIFFYGSPKGDALIWCGFVCVCTSVRYIFFVFMVFKMLDLGQKTKEVDIFSPLVCLLTWRSLKFGKGIPMVTTALALSSVKSSPSLTLPLQTAISSAPSITKKCHTVHITHCNMIL